ncbi:hypothetical protein ABQE93_26770 [Mycolicibacterium sp. XJ662]
MSASLRLVPPPITCAPWCRAGDGHPDALFAEDQFCMGEWHVTPVSHDDDGGKVSVLAYQKPGKLPDVDIEVEVDRPDSLHLTPTEARSLAAALIAVADVVDSEDEAVTR